VQALNLATRKEGMLETVDLRAGWADELAHPWRFARVGVARRSRAAHPRRGHSRSIARASRPK